MKDILKLVAVALSICSPAIAQQTDRNLQLSLEAARAMEWDPVFGENYPFMLVKRETIRTEIGLIFGYVDNETACKAIANALTQSAGLGSFECDIVH